MKISVLGSGGWGTALAMLLLENGNEVTLWSYSHEESEQLRTTGKNHLLPEVQLPAQLQYTSDLACVKDAQVVVMATPSFAVRTTAESISPLLSKDAILVSVSKGIEGETGQRLSQVIAREIGHKCPVAVLTGPSHAEEVARNMATGCVAACEDLAVAEAVQDLFLNDRFRVYSSTDIVGVEFGAALKNVMALCCGISTGMGGGDNTKAMLMTRGLAEMARLGVAMGGKHETFAGLAGMGDLIVTCTSLNSRNNRAGILIGKGMAVEQAVGEIGAVVEGYYAVAAVKSLAEKAGVEMPITEAAYGVLYEGKDMHEAFRQLMLRNRRHETEDSWG